MEDPWLRYIHASASTVIPTLETMILDQSAGAVTIWVKTDGSVERRNARLSEVLTACLHAALSSNELALLGVETTVVSSLQAVECPLSICPAQGLLSTHPG